MHSPHPKVCGLVCRRPRRVCKQASHVAVSLVAGGVSLEISAGAAAASYSPRSGSSNGASGGSQSLKVTRIQFSSSSVKPSGCKSVRALTQPFW